jgi:peroxiredoxin (alkyl hydroperoxide reductase subunit C)
MCDDHFPGDVLMTGNRLPVIGREIADFEVEFFQHEKIEKTHLSHYRGQWMVFVFYPADFTFVCPTELEELTEIYPKFQSINTEIFSVSTDTVFAHKAWHDHSPAIGKVRYPMIADPTGDLCREFGVYIDAEGVALRGTFVVDPDGVLQAYEVHANNIGRSAEELLRKVQAAQFVREHGGEVCPAKWKPGDKTLKPGLDLVGKI